MRIPRSIARCTRRRALALVVIVAGSLPGCTPFTYGGVPCGPEYRDTRVATDVRGSTATVLVSVNVALDEVRDDSVPGSLIFVAFANGTTTGEPLKGHVTRAALLDASGAVVQELPISAGGGNVVVSALPVVVREAARVEALRQHLLNGTLVLLLQTDRPDTPELRTPLPRAIETGFQRLICD